jgi:hypothetical protein
MCLSRVAISPQAHANIYHWINKQNVNEHVLPLLLLRDGPIDRCGWGGVLWHRLTKQLQAWETQTKDWKTQLQGYLLTKLYTYFLIFPFSKNMHWASCSTYLSWRERRWWQNSWMKLRSKLILVAGVCLQLRSSRNFCVDIILLVILLGIAAFLYKFVPPPFLAISVPYRVSIVVLLQTSQ